MFRIYYDDGLIVQGSSSEDWRAAPDLGVQVVARFPQLEGLRHHYSQGPVLDRDLWTGEDEFDPFGWGVKFGAWMDFDAYISIWEQACADTQP